MPLSTKPLLSSCLSMKQLLSLPLSTSPLPFASALALALASTLASTRWPCVVNQSSNQRGGQHQQLHGNSPASRLKATHRAISASQRELSRLEARRRIVSRHLSADGMLIGVLVVCAVCWCWCCVLCAGAVCWC